MAAGQNKESPHLSKRMRAVRGKVDHIKTYPLDEALKLVKETATAKFDESVDAKVLDRLDEHLARGTTAVNLSS